MYINQVEYRREHNIFVGWNIAHGQIRPSKDYRFLNWQLYVLPSGSFHIVLIPPDDLPCFGSVVSSINEAINFAYKQAKTINRNEVNDFIAHANKRLSSVIIAPNVVSTPVAMPTRPLAVSEMTPVELLLFNII
jgi:hypothetical protein